MQLELERIRDVGASVVAVCPETPETALATIEKARVTFPVLSDRGNHVARKFGIVFELPQELRPVYAGFGIDIPKSNGDESFELPIPATYVIGRNQKILMAFVNTDYTKRLDPDDIIEVLANVSGSSLTDDSPDLE